MEFKASLDTTAKIITAIVCILFLAIMAWNAFAMKRAKGDTLNIIIRVAIFLLLLLTIGASYLYSTKGYEIQGKSLVIKTHRRNITLTYMQINDVRKVGDNEMNGLTRSFGFGGLFGYNGHYHNSSVGDMTFYATQRKNWVLIHTEDNRAIILTPDNPDKLVYEIKAIITPNN